MHKRDFHFDLPEELIAAYPAEQRSGSRLMHLDASTGAISHYQFQDLPGLLHPTDLMVFNNTRVIRARLFGARESGGRVEILVERLLGGDEVLAQVRSSKPLREGVRIKLDNSEYLLTCLGRKDSFYHLAFPAPGVDQVLEELGHIPLPPYIHRADEALDESRYQTVYASKKGAVAAPTAGLHFDEGILSAIEAKGIERVEVTLHVGAGTFQPLRVDDLEQHQMHSEWFEIEPRVAEQINARKKAGGRVLAVGTTSVRSLESASRSGVLHPSRGETDIFIYPGYEFQMVDAMLTNFHLPESTLIMLVAAFAGREQVLTAYHEAVREGYRFFSYGDAMLVTR